MIPAHSGAWSDAHEVMQVTGVRAVWTYCPRCLEISFRLPPMPPTNCWACSSVPQRHVDAPWQGAVDAAEQLGGWEAVRDLIRAEVGGSR